MENQNRNLTSLKAEFRDKGKASRGFENIMRFIKLNKNKELEYLLRFHDPIEVYGHELVERFELDALIEYYNLLVIAVFSGYIPSQFDKSTASEIVTLLNHPSVIPYYSTFYRYEMVSYTLQFAQENRLFEQEGNSVTISSFNEFISLNRQLKRDKDIERFIGMLDFVRYNYKTINDVNEILSSYSKLNETFTKKVKSEADRGVWGFVKYVTFLSQLKEIFLATNKYPLIQSSMWMFHGYYFEKMNDKMKLIFNTAFDNLEKTLSNPEIFKSIIEQVYKDEIPENFSEIQLTEFAETSISQAREDVNFVLDIKWSEPFKKYFQKNT